MYSPDPEDFAAWQSDPITHWVFTGCRKAAADCKALWIEKSWAGGNADPAELIELRTRADAYLGLPDTPYDAWLATINGETNA